MAIKTWEAATKEALQLKEYSEFIVDDLAAKHIRAAIRWSDDAVSSAKKIKTFLKRQPGATLGAFSGSNVASTGFLLVLGVLGAYALLSESS